MKEKMLQYFESVFGDVNGVKVFFAPGRVNLIGEHTDYNGGHVFPSALTIGTYGAVRVRGDRKLRMYSANFEHLGVIESSLDDLVYNKKDDWANYPKGVLYSFGEFYHKDQGEIFNDGAKGLFGRIQKEDLKAVEQGMDLVYWGNIPNSSGLSSSASIEVLTAYMMKELFGMKIQLPELALLCQFAENRFNGVNCGIMDQFAIAMGKENHAIFLDTANLEYTYGPLALEGAKVVIACSNKKRGLGDSKYNERRSQCEEAVFRLQSKKTIASLGELTVEEFEQYKDVIGDETLVRRAKHGVYENIRTMKAVEALQNNDIELFGQLMNESHISLRDDYEVTGIELDTLVETAWGQAGVIGARMTGAGFGGCTVNIVKDQSIDSFILNVGKTYEEKIGYKADFYVVEIGGGPQEL